VPGVVSADDSNVTCTMRVSMCMHAATNDVTAADEAMPSTPAASTFNY